MSETNEDAWIRPYETLPKKSFDMKSVIWSSRRESKEPKKTKKSREPKAAKKLQAKNKQKNKQSRSFWQCLLNPFFLGFCSFLGLFFVLFYFTGSKLQFQDREDSEVLAPENYDAPVQDEGLLWQEWKSTLLTRESHLQQDEALVVMLKRYGLAQKESSDLVLSIRSEAELEKLRTQDPILLYYSDNDKLVGFQLDNKEKAVEAYLYNGEIKNEILYHEMRPEIFSGAVTVMHSLYQDGVDGGIPGGILLEMFNRYSFDINFQSDIQRGTRYELVYSMVYNENNEVVSSGDILYANITLANGKSFPIFEYTDISGKSEYFNASGRSVNKALLMIPVNGAYVSSRFGYRKDPIYGTWRLHRGTDYAAPTGTPIKAGGAGTIIRRGWTNVGYGNHIIIRHSNGYDTLYGHMSRFRKGFHVGSKVRQGDIIGYIGSTGKSTGPHVHYEVRRYGKPISIKSLHLQASRSLRGVDLNLFKLRVQTLQARFKDMLPDLYDMNLPLNLAQGKQDSQKANNYGNKRNAGGSY